MKAELGSPNVEVNREVLEEASVVSVVSTIESEVLDDCPPI